MAKMCAFCPADAVEKGGEHIWDDWLNKAQPKKKSLYRARKRYAIDSPVIQYDTTTFGEQLPVVCEKCNSGWMSALTNQTKQAFSRAMLDGEPFTLGLKNAALLTAFAMKAVVTNHALDYDPFFTRAARERFRTSLVVPPFVQMWFAAYQGTSRMSTKNNMSIFGANDPDGPFYGMEFCSHSYVVGKLALQLLAPRWKHINQRGRGLLMVTPNKQWDSAAIRFWPHGGVSLSWPPAKYLGNDSIELFIYRFKKPINVPIPGR